LIFNLSWAQSLTEDGASLPSKSVIMAPSNPLDRAIELNSKGVFAEAATAFDQIYESQADLSTLLRAGIAWYQGGFLAAAEARFQRWIQLATEMGDKAPEAIAQRLSTVESLLQKASANVYTVQIEVPEDVYRPRASRTRLVATKMSDGFAPEGIAWALVPEHTITPKRIRLDAGRWLFEFEGELYQKQAEIIEIYDDSPLILSPIPSNQMLPKNTPSDERLAYREALDLFRSGDFSGAVNTLQQMVPKGLSVNEAIWLFARASEKRGAWKDAEDGYRTLLKTYPETLDAKFIDAKLIGLNEKAQSARAVILISSRPKGATIKLFKGKQEVTFGAGQKIHPGTYRVNLRWETGVVDDQLITVKPKQPQTFYCESAKAADALLALRWSVRAHLQAGISLMSGNQSELVDVSVGPALMTGVDLAWLWKDHIKLSTGLAYVQSHPNFEVGRSGARDGYFGHWVFHHLRMPVGFSWVMPSKTEIGIGSGVDVLLYASERGSETKNITSVSNAVTAILQLTASHPLSVLGKGFFLEVSYQRHLNGITEQQSALRLQQVGLGISKRVF
jgi:tetratricopeptide (TPR) repeat protein